MARVILSMTIDNIYAMTKCTVVGCATLERSGKNYKQNILNRNDILLTWRDVLSGSAPAFEKLTVRVVFNIKVSPH